VENFDLPIADHNMSSRAPIKYLEFQSDWCDLKAISKFSRMMQERYLKYASQSQVRSMSERLYEKYRKCS